MLSSVVDLGLGDVEKRLRSVVASEIGLLQDASEHIITSGGKRIRPQVLFLSFLACGGEDLTPAVPLASAIELVHTATLVHDDINDHSLTRRGKISVHARWGRTFALLTGDFLFTKVYELMAPYGSEYNIIMAEACVRLVEGETLQAKAAKSGDIDRETYKKIVSLKTASLFEAAANMGARLANSDSEYVDALTRYGYNLGLAFQIVDDILDVVGDPKTIGKPVGTDLVQGTGALMTQNGKKLKFDAVATAELDSIQKMMLELRNSGVVELAKAQAQTYSERANSALSILPSSEAREELHQIVNLILERNK